MKPLENLREKIDKIDDRILDLLNKRAGFALEVKQIRAGKTSIRPERESTIIKRLCRQNSGPMPDGAVQAIFTQIIASSRDQLQLDRPIIVSYLGPPGTYSQEAASKLFGNSISLQPENSIAAVVRAVEVGSSELAVVPIENSSEGAVRETHRLLLTTNTTIVTEVTIPIIHSLLSKESDNQNIKSIYAHPQALGQCRTWLALHLPKANQIATSSNASAAEAAAKNKKSAAIASPKAAELYNLRVKDFGINDQPGNETRFIALGKHDTQPTGDDKTSLICVLNDKAGALHEILSVLVDKNISMTRLESQPYQTGQYAFYIDFKGHRHETAAAEAINKIDSMTKICRILGSYPSGMKA